MHQLRFQNKICMSLRGLSFLSMTEQAPALMLTRLVRSSLQRQHLEREFNQHALLWSSMSSKLPSKGTLCFLLQVVGVRSRQMVAYMNHTGPHFEKH